MTLKKEAQASFFVCNHFDMSRLSDRGLFGKQPCSARLGPAVGQIVEREEALGDARVGFRDEGVIADVECGGQTLLAQCVV